MTSEEFREWYAYHKSRFTGIENWMDKITTGSDAPSRRDVLSGWLKTLMSVELQSAKDATDTLHSGEEPEPKGFDRHPATIRAIANRNKKTHTFQSRPVVEGQETYACLSCHDIGVIVCWHPIAMRHFRDTGSLDGCKVITCVRACNCPTGDDYARSYGLFDPKKWLEYLGDTNWVNIERLKDFIGNSKDKRREKAFDAFGV